jgi:hypothetical protein
LVIEDNGDDEMNVEGENQQDPNDLNVNDDTGVAIFLKDLANNKKVPTSQNTTAMENDAHVSSPDQDAQHHVADKAEVTNDPVVKKTMSFFVTCCL